MNSTSLCSFVLIPPPPCYNLRPLLQTKHQPILHSLNLYITKKPTFLRATDSNTDAPVSLPEGAWSVVPIAEIIEKDWSLLDGAENQTIERIISAANVEESSRVLVSTGSEDFVDSLVGLTSSLFVVHDSLLTLACVKEKYDKVKCWQGEILHVPEKWAPFNAVFLYFLPALPFKLEEILGSLAGKCAPGEFSL